MLSTLGGVELFRHKTNLSVIEDKKEGFVLVNMSISTDVSKLAATMVPGPTLQPCMPAPGGKCFLN
jgi:hypothetical protein